MAIRRCQRIPITIETPDLHDIVETYSLYGTLYPRQEYVKRRARRLEPRHSFCVQLAVLACRSSSGAIDE